MAQQIEAIDANGGNDSSEIDDMIAARERKSAATHGHVLVEKGTPSPPGVPGHVAWSALENKDALTKGLVLRVQVCDAGGYVVRVAQVTL